MICIFCSKRLGDMEEPSVIQHLAFGLALGPKDKTGIDITNAILCGSCSDAIMNGLKASRAEAATMREKVKEQAVIEQARKDQEDNNGSVSY